jgi:hypothetical protein
MVGYAIKKRRRTDEYHQASETINRQVGFRDIRKDPEEKVKNFLSIWLESNGCKVYWEKKNNFNKPIFNAKKDSGGTCEKPDILVERFGSSGDPVYYALEVKDASSTSNVYDSFPQVLRYAEGDLDFSIDSSHVDVEGYFSANLYSMYGKLFSNDILNNPETFSDGRKAAILKGELPENEYMLTEEYLRLLWRMAKELKIENRVGALLSTALNGCNTAPSPMIQFADIKYGSSLQGVEVWHK